MNSIIPTVFALSKKEFDSRFDKLVKLSKDIQIDFMDGRFVSETSIRIVDLPNLKKYSNNFEAHLMVSNPEIWISDLKEKGFKKVIFHYEVNDDMEKAKYLTFLIKSKKMKAFIAFNPITDFSKIIHVIRYVDGIDGVLLMGHDPGFEHLEINPNIYRKIRNIRLESKRISIQVDGGVNLGVAKELRSAGADIVNIGSFVYESKDPKEALDRLKKAFI